MFGELCKTCLLYHPFFVCLTETHLSGDPVDSICPPGYVIAAHHDRTKHGGGVLILARDSCLFDEIDTTAVAIPGTAELVAIAYCELLIVCCYRQPSQCDTSLISSLDTLLDSHQHLTPFICGDFNVHEHSWLSSTHSSTAGTATKDFSDSRGLLQLVDFPTRGTAILDLVLYGHQGSIQSFSAFNTSDHLVLLVTVSMSTPDFVISSLPFIDVFITGPGPIGTAHLTTFHLSLGTCQVLWSPLFHVQLL